MPRILGLIAKISSFIFSFAFSFWGKDSLLYFKKSITGFSNLKFSIDKNNNKKQTKSPEIYEFMKSKYFFWGKKSVPWELFFCWQSLWI